MRNLPAWARILVKIVLGIAIIVGAVALLKYVLVPLAIWAFVSFIYAAVTLAFIALMVSLIIGLVSKDAVGHFWRAIGQGGGTVAVWLLKPLGYKPPEKDKKKKKT